MQDIQLVYSRRAMGKQQKEKKKKKSFRQAVTLFSVEVEDSKIVYD